MFLALFVISALTAFTQPGRVTSTVLAVASTIIDDAPIACADAPLILMPFQLYRELRHRFRVK
jgi:hypothetical protein